MSIGKIGQPHKIVYASRNFVSGLSNISIKVLKPNGSVHSSGTMSEFSESGFEGIYYYDMPSNSVDPEGEYSVSITSPTEGHKAKTKVTMVESFGGAGSSDEDISGIEVELDVSRPKADLQSEIRSIGLNMTRAFASLSATARKAILEINKASEDLVVAKPLIEIEVECDK